MLQAVLWSICSYQFSIVLYSRHDSYSIMKIYALNQLKHSSPSVYFFHSVSCMIAKNIIENIC